MITLSGPMGKQNPHRVIPLFGELRRYERKVTGLNIKRQERR